MSSIKYWKKIEEQCTYAEATGTAILIRGKAFRGLDPLGLATLEGWPAGSAAESLVLFVLRALGTTGVAGKALGTTGATGGALEAAGGADGATGS